MRETGLHWTTHEKILSHPEPPGYRVRQDDPQPQLGPDVGRIREILEADQACPVKQRHTVKRIFERLQEESYGGGYTQVKAVVRELRQHSREVYNGMVAVAGWAEASTVDA